MRSSSPKVYKGGEFHGEVILSREVGAVHFAVAERKAGTTVPIHCHETATFVLLLKGSHHWVNESGKIEWSVPGVWYFRPPMYEHTHESCTSDITSLGIHFPAKLATKLTAEFEDTALDSPMGHAIAEELVKNLKVTDAASDHALMGLFHALTAAYLRGATSVKEQRVRDWLARARTWLDENFLRPVTLSHCANAVGAHPSHLAREFRNAFGRTVGDYIRDKRLEWAHEQLVRNARKISDIAVAAGFADHAHFSRVFKSRYGFSPSKVRRF